ncbi:bifunctional 23S rRNA (guanine(2069)-N(7))-methyltransferase RlmK/23S rRNA (guanine(2445)-N(2))-methyltransferase RlmL [Parathalassolituus penaei]|uniref:Ribosomal RNA large subunit methyltransferase K/L n=1 Tax=Parathalassolituus penaei TaxID=2997323 RepID=A0A9X3EPK5_9GAMM|nr:bifunctional 23S rRNA (guanine(2069)-N(7))-methyltransferase RlmK/23S rRNA (guanine(2445)-N(2))-methyltransferase RlmL [Parathalassolituus penaei]MCY0966508.1 bifunctional 23S rRNA (guanine(2069)-N(7))-methyltransferase RlmK/23S rRNA (guanine(2445)-N(2))-methyltransferase RlmL [Parathalassolituus penaei]
MMQNHPSSETFTWLASCAKGIEPLLVQEISELGGEVERETHLGVFWRGDLKTAYRFCLWSRLASRLLLPLHECQVGNVDEVYEETRQLPWNEIFPVSASMRIDFHGQTDFINNTQFGAQKIKDAICDRFRLDTGSRPNVDKDAQVRIEAQLRKGKLHLYFNFSGSGMHRRGYRLQPGLAPLKETLAAAVLMRAGWPALAAEGKHLIDPMCGSGTLVIEAGLMAADVAPGLNRQQHGFEYWRGHDRSIWLELVDDARQRRTAGLNAMKSHLYGFDIDARQLEAAQANLARSGLSGKVHLERRGIDQLRVNQDVAADGGLVVCNPPYGERLSELPQLAPLYQQFHDATMKLPDWRLAVFTGNTDLARSIRRPLDKQYNLLNGLIATRLLVFGAADERSAQPRGSMIRGPVEQFANRLAKNLKPLQKWARRESVYCYRVYDADLPEYAVAIDVYTAADQRDAGETGQWLHVQEYVPPKTIDEARAERRLLDVLAVLPEVTGIDAQRIVLKRRERQSGKRQYEKQDSSRNMFAVPEGKVLVNVNLRDYLDTGLFLDHRPTRLEIAKLAAQQPGMKFLNLFCYTATASVHAAVAGAHCTSVDMSRTYLNWGRDNFELNDIDPDRHNFVQADCLRWLEEAAERQQGTYDLIFMDPPTFSNSKRMEGVLDIQRDHATLIRQAVACLKPGGLLIFSNNLRKFDLDEEALAGLKIRNVSGRSVPHDYARRPNIHHCYHIQAG